MPATATDNSAPIPDDRQPVTKSTLPTGLSRPRRDPSSGHRLLIRSQALRHVLFGPRPAALEDPTAWAATATCLDDARRAPDDAKRDDHADRHRHGADALRRPA
jgi:hypothetical protein